MKKLFLMAVAALSLSACTGNAEGEGSQKDSTATETQEVAATDPTAVPVLAGEDGEKDGQAVYDYLKANLDQIKDLKEIEGVDDKIKLDSLVKVMEEFAKKNPAYEEGVKKALGDGKIEKLMEEKMKELLPGAAAAAEEEAK